MPLDLTADERAQLAADVAEELDTGRYGDRFVLSRRQLLSLAGGSAGVAGLTALGVDPATAQSAAGQVGTEASPENVFAYDLDVQGALQRDLDAGGQAISNVGSLSTQTVSNNSAKVLIDSTFVGGKSSTVILSGVSDDLGIITLVDNDDNIAEFAIDGADVVESDDFDSVYGTAQGADAFNLFYQSGDLTFENTGFGGRTFSYIYRGRQ